MEDEQINARIARRSAMVYLPISIGAAILFFIAASLVGEYTLVARIGGSAWVGLLSLIVTMPVVTSRVKQRIRGHKPV